MYLSATNESLEILSDASATTTEPQYNIGYNDHTSTGMVLPQSSSFGNLTGNTPVTALSAPPASINRQIATISIYNADSTSKTITVQKDVGGIPYIIIQSYLSAGASLFYSREHGWTINSGTSINYKITEFTSNGTWTKPSGLKFAWVWCIGAGGGGGSGRRGAAGTNRFGGGGGCGGASSQYFFRNSDLLSSYAITIGIGGTGGAGVLIDDTDGNPGIVGGDTSFGVSVIAKGGPFGAGGTTTNGLGGVGSSTQQGACTIPYLPYSCNGVQGGNGSTNANGGQPTGAWNFNVGGGGAGGCGINSANVSNAFRASGSYPRNLTVSIPNNIYPNLVLPNWGRMFFNNQSIVGNIGLGSGGIGGSSTVLNATNGQNYGAGGGGGAGVLNGTTSGAGGNGSNGLCIILEIY